MKNSGRVRYVSSSETAEMLRLKALGWTYADIGRSLDVSEGTVFRHVNGISGGRRGHGNRKFSDEQIAGFREDAKTMSVSAAARKNGLSVTHGHEVIHGRVRRPGGLD